MKKNSLIILIFISLQSSLFGNFFVPFNYLWVDTNKGIKLFTVLSAGRDSIGFNEQSDKVSALQYLDKSQNALAMLKGAPVDSLAYTIAQQCVLNDDGLRGRYTVTGQHRQSISAIFGFRWGVSENWWIGAFTSVAEASLKNVQWQDQTNDKSVEDIAFETLVEENFLANVKTLSNGLTLGDWHKRGMGDISLWTGWQHNFVQMKDWIKSVTPRIRGGFLIPTGVKENPDKFFFHSFGNDGTPGIQVGIGLTVNLKHVVNFGIDVEFLHSFTTTRERRIKTDPDQTALLLTKTRVSKDPGMLQRFTLLGEILLNENVRIGSQYIFTKESESYLYPLSNIYSTTIANTSLALKGFTSHIATIQIGFKQTPTDEHEGFSGFLCYLHPFNGKRSVAKSEFVIGLRYTF